MGEDKKKEKKLKKKALKVILKPYKWPIIIGVMLFLMFAMLVFLAIFTVLGTSEEVALKKMTEPKKTVLETEAFDYKLTIMPKTEKGDTGTAKLDINGENIDVNGAKGDLALARDKKNNIKRVSFDLKKSSDETAKPAQAKNKLLKEGGDGWSKNQWKVAITVYEALKNKGFSDAAAAGAVGSLAGESGFNTKALNKKSGAYGIAQWIGGRKKSLFEFASKKGGDASDFKIQAAFLVKEVNGGQFAQCPFYPETDMTLKEYKKLKSPKKAAQEWTKHFERCSRGEYESSIDGREKAAVKVANALDGLTGEGDLTAHGSITKSDEGYHISISGTYNGGFYEGLGETTGTAQEGEGLDKVVEFAKKQTKKNYPYGRSGWHDFGEGDIQCHAFTAQCFRHCGYQEVYEAIWKKNISKNPKRLAKCKSVTLVSEKHLPESKMQPGDIVFKKLGGEYGRKGYHHSAIYIGNGKVANQVSGGDHTRISNYKKSYYLIFRVSSSGTLGSSIGDKAAEWAIRIANDDSFSYGATATKIFHQPPDNNGGCYFCDKRHKKWYCCNTFVMAAYTHGAGIKKKCGGSGTNVKSWKNKGFKYLGKSGSEIKLSQLLPGDVMVRENQHHVAIYVGNNKLAHAASHTDSKARSIRVQSVAADSTCGKWFKHGGYYILRHKNSNGTSLVSNEETVSLAKKAKKLASHNPSYKYRLGGWTLSTKGDGIDCAHFCGLVAHKCGLVGGNYKSRFADCGTIRDNYKSKTIASNIDGKPIKESVFKKGDILLFGIGKGKYLRHAAIYIGNGKIAHAMDSSHGVVVSDLNYDESTGKVYSGKILKFVVRLQKTAEADEGEWVGDIAIEQDITAEEFKAMVKGKKINKAVFEGVGYYGPKAEEYALGGGATAGVINGRRKGMPSYTGWYVTGVSDKNPFSVNPKTGGNCTWYAWGRFAEILGRFPGGLCGRGNAVTWYYTTSYKKGQTPKLGAVAVWGYGGSKHGQPGHVAVVEEIKKNGDVVVSQSGYRTGGWWESTHKKSQNYKANFNNAVFVGFIYQP